MTTITCDEDNPHEHKPWCAAVIAANAELPWRVRCDCKPPKPRQPKVLPLLMLMETAE